MKPLIFLLIILLCSSCAQEQAYRINLVFSNGDKDSIVIKSSTLAQFFLGKSGCVWAGERKPPFNEYCVACNVRSFKIDTIKSIQTAR